MSVVLGRHGGRLSAISVVVKPQARTVASTKPKKSATGNRKHMLASPVASAGVESHADWLEMKALLAPDGDVSYQDLVSELRRNGSLDAFAQSVATDAGSEKSQELADTVFAHLDLRSIACGSGYPFNVGPQTLTRKDSSALDSTYAFLLLLRTFGVRAGPARTKAASLFEEIATVVAGRYLGGPDKGAETFHFGFPRSTTPAGFESALNLLCSRLQEGGQTKKRPAKRHQKDAKLDLVAWRPFPDQRNGKIVAFGQCAAGDNWDGKAAELRPQSFMGLWMTQGRLAFTPMVFFFLPHCLDDDDWDSISMIGDTIPFDRCRITSLIAESVVAGDLPLRIKKWNANVLARVEAK